MAGMLAVSQNSTEVKKEEKSPAPGAAQPFLDITSISCNVCLEILHNSINCGPCNHKFCAACIYRWLDAHHTCPKCRNIVKEVTRDVFANDVCQQYIQAYPEKSRSMESIDELDRVELEYLEKLMKRAKTVRPTVNEEQEEREAEFDVNDPFREIEEELLNLDGHRNNHLPPGVIPVRRLFLSGAAKFREKEWRDRSRRLRELLNMTPREPSPDPPANQRDQDYRSIYMMTYGGEDFLPRHAINLRIIAQRPPGRTLPAARRTLGPARPAPTATAVNHRGDTPEVRIVGVVQREGAPPPTNPHQLARMRLASTIVERNRARGRPPGPRGNRRAAIRNREPTPAPIAVTASFRNSAAPVRNTTGPVRSSARLAAARNGPYNLRRRP